MITQIKNTSDQIGELVFPPSIETLDQPNVVNAIERQRTAKVARVALFIFSTIATVVVTALAETNFLAGIWMFPAFLGVLACWGIFCRIHYLENAYVENATDDVRQDLAKRQLERLFFETPLEDGISLQQLYPFFNHVNTLLDVEIFSEEVLLKFSKLDFTNSNNKTLFEIAQEQAIDLSLNLEAERFEPGRFGRPSYTYKANIQWDGNKTTPITVTKGRSTAAELNHQNIETAEAESIIPESASAPIPDEAPQPNGHMALKDEHSVAI